MLDAWGLSSTWKATWKDMVKRSGSANTSKKAAKQPCLDAPGVLAFVVFFAGSAKDTFNGARVLGLGTIRRPRQKRTLKIRSPQFFIHKIGAQLYLFSEMFEVFLFEWDVRHLHLRLKCRLTGPFRSPGRVFFWCSEQETHHKAKHSTT